MVNLAKEAVEVNVASGEMKLYACDFLILATGVTNEGHIPKVGGLENFKGEKIHSRLYLMNFVIDIDDVPPV
ncbi:hypothetical protein MTR67_040403 [Solanum verrucosum]|uniref:Uncharacterized protein n=1 Tax=Solanum verrucosum TaxID=315347 RepID=A0AAF0UII9_SOLVR|nr:hypothetical protein MTR67_040403 [Solanum verrucosum]